MIADVVAVDAVGAVADAAVVVVALAEAAVVF